MPRSQMSATASCITFIKLWNQREDLVLVFFYSRSFDKGSGRPSEDVIKLTLQKL